MTFLKTRFILKKEPADTDMARATRLYTVYGIRDFQVRGQELIIEYDASRIHEAEVLAQVRASGFSVAPLQPIAPGGFDYTGEFRDYVWPTQGLSPVNQKAK